MSSATHEQFGNRTVRGSLSKRLNRKFTKWKMASHRGSTVVSLS